jgi:DNA polymerase I-like protein with 3'-5' exonuclease and polymerase domains
MLNSPLLAFDIETDTEEQHWETGDRGLSYCTDITYISLFDGERTLVLTAQPYSESYTYYDEHGVVTTREVRQRVTKKADFEALQATPPSGGVVWELDGTKYGSLVHTEPLTRTRYRFSDEEIDFLRQIFQPEHMKRTLIAHNLVFDARQIFGKFGLDPYHRNIAFWDTLVMEILGMWGPIKENALLEMAKRYTTIDPDTETWLEGMKKQRKSLHKADPEDIPPYVAWDSVAAYNIYCGQLERSFYEGLSELIPKEQEYTRWCVLAAAKGIQLDVDYAHKRRLELLAEWERSLEALGLSVEEEAKTRKREWLEEYIFERIEHPSEDVIADKPFLKTGAGAWSFGADALKFYLGTIAVGAEDNDEDEEWYDARPELTALAEHKAVEAVLRRLEEFLRHAEYDGRIHSIIVGSALTGRSVSSAPNVQNINFDDFAGYLVSDQDYVLIELDYSNAENWASAMYTRDYGLAHACAQQDFHSAMAAKYFGERWLKADAKERKMLRFFSKRITFGTAYGMGAGKLARSLGITQEEAQGMLAAKDRAFPFVAESKARASAWASEKGWTLLWSGRRCQIGSRDGKIKGYTAHNTQMQGGVAEIVRNAITGIQQYLYDTARKSYVATMIHDSLIIAMHVDEYRELAVHLIQMMGSVVPSDWLTRTEPPIRWLTDIDHGKNAKKWGLVVGREYPFPLDEYVNQWGFHRLPEGTTEAPVWINQWGWGEQALERELSGENSLIVAPTKMVVDWAGFREAVREVSSAMSPQNWNGKVYDFPEAIALHEVLEHRGQENHLREYIHLFDRLEVYINQYKGWKGTPK